MITSRRPTDLDCLVLWNWKIHIDIKCALDIDWNKVVTFCVFSLQGFRDGRFPCLIATDVAARGLDIPEVDLVIQCNPPKVSYV